MPKARFRAMDLSKVWSRKPGQATNRTNIRTIEHVSIPKMPSVKLGRVGASY